MKRVLKARDIERLENTGFVAALLPPGLPEPHLAVCGCSFCTACSIGTLCVGLAGCCAGTYGGGVGVPAVPSVPPLPIPPLPHTSDLIPRPPNPCPGPHQCTL